MVLNGNALTEKGMVKAGARKALTEFVNANREVFANAVRNDNGTYSLAVNDSEGNVVFVNFEVTVSTMNAGDRAKRKSKSRAKVTEDLEVVE